MDKVLRSAVRYLSILWDWITCRSRKKDVESIGVSYPIIKHTHPLVAQRQEARAGAYMPGAVACNANKRDNPDVQFLPVEVPQALAGESPCIPFEFAREDETETVDSHIQPEHGNEDKGAGFTEQPAPSPSSPCPSLCKSVVSSVASAASTSAPPTPLPLTPLGDPKVRTEDHEAASFVSIGSRIHDVPELVFPDAQFVEHEPGRSVLPSSPVPLIRKASSLVPIQPPACNLTEADPFGTFAESYFADKPQVVVVKANAAPDLYNFDIYALSSTPPKRQRTREVRTTRKARKIERRVHVPRTTDKGKTASPVITSIEASSTNACASSEEDQSQARPRLRALLLPQEVERRESREGPYCTAPARGIRPLMLPLHVAKRGSTTDGPQPPYQSRMQTSRLSLPAAKSPASNPPLRARCFSDVPDLKHGSGASLDAIEIEEKADRRTRNIANLVLMLDKFGITGDPRHEDLRRSATVAVAGTHSAEGVRGRPEVPGRIVLDDSQGKQDGTCGGGVSAAFDNAGDALRYSRKLDDIVILLGLPGVQDALPRTYGLEHADEV